MSDVSTYDTEHSIGENNVQFLGLDMHNPVFFISAVLVVLFVIGTIMFPEPASVALSAAKAFAINNFDCFFAFLIEFGYIHFIF